MTQGKVRRSFNARKECCGGISRRAFLATSAAAGALPFVAGPFDARAFADTHPTHRVPADKKLSPEWKKSLYERGEPKEWTGDELNTIGMPIGGIGAGQLYLTGDGTFAVWGLYNERRFSKRDGARFLGHELNHGFALETTVEGQPPRVSALNRATFPNVRFIGEYPIARVKYPDPTLPVEIELEAFSPFIPLNAEDSSLPASLLHFHVRNRAEKPVQCRIAGWLENPVGVLSARDSVMAGRGQRLRKSKQATQLEFYGLDKPPAGRRAAGPSRVFADFEGDSYGDWKAEGEAMGTAPVRGRVDSGDAGDAARGKLISPEFEIDRPFINFKIGGGPHRNTTCMKLFVGGKEVRQATGDYSDKLIWKFWKVVEFQGRRAHLEIIDAHRGGRRSFQRFGHVLVDQIEFADEPRTEVGAFSRRCDFGTASLALFGKAEGAATDLPCPVVPEGLFAADGIFAGASTKQVEYELQDARCGALGRTFTLAPGESRTIVFALAWHFPVRPWDSNGYDTLVLDAYEASDGEGVGNHYARRFGSARAVGEYLARHHVRLADETRRYHRVFYEESTLPRWLLLRVGHTPSILASATVHWRKDGRFWGWEGVGCCAGTCTHVWNYAQAPARLFPQLERSVREMQDLAPGVGLADSGRVHYRGDSTWEVEGIDYAADGQAGTVLKSYREHLMSADDSFLKRNWPNIKRALEYQMSRDDNGDGILEDQQHTTYDEDIYGANTFIGSLYLAALRAGEEMARRMGEEAFADECRRRFVSGSRLSVERLWNGEYFIQEVDIEKHPRNQYGQGCLSDQLFGQGWAHQVGLGDLYPKEMVRSALRAIYKYNWAPDVGPQTEAHRPSRWFALAGDAGLFVCTFPKGEQESTERRRYFFECWTGVEYQAAGHMLHEGLLEEGLCIIRAVHDRHNGVRWNPYNEFECGNHYARAMAAWGCLLALAGFEYDGPGRRLGFSPRMNREDFRAFFSTAESWGSLVQREERGARRCRVEVEYGRLELEELTLDATGVKDAAGVRARLSGRDLPVRATLQADRLALRFDPTRLRAGESLSVEIPI